MATEADIPEDVSVKRREKEDRTPTECSPSELIKSGYGLNKPTESLINKQVMDIIGVELTNKASSSTRTPKQESLVESHSPDKVETPESSTSEHYQDDKIQNQAAMEIQENERQHQDGAQIEDAATGSEKNEVNKEITKGAEQGEEIEHDIRDSSPLTFTEEPNLKIDGKETSKDRRTLDQQLEVFSDQQESTKEIPETMDKETKISHEDENRGAERDQSTDMESTEQVASTVEATLGQKREVPYTDMETKSLSNDDEREIKACVEDENKDNKFSSDTIYFGDECRETSSKREQNEKEESFSELKGEEKGPDPEDIRSIKNIENDKDEEYDPVNGRTGNASIVSVVEGPSYIHHDEEHTLQADSHIGDNSTELEKPPLALETDGDSTQEAEIEADRTFEEASGIACKEKNQDLHESRRDEKNVHPVDKMDKAQESVGGNIDEKAASEADISLKDPTEASEDSKMVTTENEDQERSSCQQIEQVENKLEIQANMMSESTEVAAPRENPETEICQKEQQYIKDPVESHEEIGMEDEPISTSDINHKVHNTIHTLQILPLLDSNEKTESAKEEFQDNGATNLNIKYPMVETEKAVGGTANEASKSEHLEKVEGSNTGCVEKEKQVDYTTEACKAMRSKITEDTTMERTEIVELISKTSNSIEELKEVHDLGSDEKLKVNYGGKNMPEKTKKKKEDTIEDESAANVSGSSTIRFIEKKYQEESHKEAQSNLSNDDKSHRSENEARDEPSIRSREGISKERRSEGSREKIIKDSQNNDKETDKLREESTEEITRESHLCNLPSDFVGEGEYFPDDVKEIENSKEESLNELQSSRKGEDISCKTNHNVEGAKEVPDTLLKQEGESLCGERDSIAPKGDYKDKDEDTYNPNMAEDNDDNNGLSKTPEKGEMATLKCEDDSKTILQNDEQIEKPKEFLDVISEGAEVANSGENPENTTCMNREEITSISGEILENKKENTIEEVSKGSQKEASKSAAEKQVLENTVGELSSDLLGEETGKEDSKEENCDEVKVTLTNSEIKEQSKETKLMEEKECEALEVRTQPKQDLDALTDNPHRKEIDKNLFVESCFASETLDKETEDEIHGEEDSTIDDSANEHVVVLNGERGLNKFKPEAAPDKNDISITHLEAKAGLHSVDGNEEQEKNTKPGEDTNMEILQVADVGGEEDTIMETTMHIAVVAYTEAVLEEENIAEIFAGSSTDVVAKKEETELEAGASGEQEPAWTKNNELLTEKVHGEVDKADESENFQGQLIEGKISLSETHKVSAGDKTGKEVEVTSSEFKDQTEITESLKEKDSETIGDQSAPNNYHSTLSSNKLSETSAGTSYFKKVSEKETEVDVFKQDVHNMNVSVNVFVTTVSEDPFLKEVKLEKEGAVKGFYIAPDEKGPTISETKATNSDGEDIAERQECVSNPEENSYKEIEEVADEGQMKMDHRIEDKDTTTSVPNKGEMTISSMPAFQDSNMMSIEEDNSIASARVNSIDEAPEREETAHENAERRESARENAKREENAHENSESSSLVHTTETKFLPKAHEFETESASKLEFADILNEDLHRPSEQKAGNMGDKKISSNRRTSDTADQNKAYKLDTKERLLNVASRCVAVTTCIDGAEAILQTEDLSPNSEGILTDVVIEKAASELEANASSHEHEPTDTKNKLSMEKNFEPAADNHSSGELPQTKENNNNIHDQNSESAGHILEQKIQGETQTETESLLEVEQKLETGIVTENVKEEVESKTYGNDKIQEQLVKTVRSPKISKSVSAADKIVDEVTTTNSEFVNLIEATDLTEAKESEILDDYAEPKKDLNSFITAQESEEGTDTRESKMSLGENHHLVPGEAEEDPKSEIFKQEDNIDNISITLIGTLVHGETGLKETKPEIKEKLRDSNAAPQEQDETVFVTETRSDTVDTNERQQKNFNSDANREQIPKTADEGGEEKDHSIEEKTHTAEVDHVKEVSTSSIPPSEDNLQNISVPPPRDTVINKMSYLIEETPAKYESTYENAEPTSVKSKHELLKELRTTGTEESANEEIQKQENEKLHMASCLNTEQCTSDTEISKTKEVSDLADQNEACILETEKDEKPSSEALKHVKAITCIDDEKAIQEQEDPAKNFKDSLTCTMVENEATELDAGGLSEKHEPANCKTTELLRRKNHELDHPYEKLEFPAVAHDQIDDQHPQSKEDGNNIQEQNPETLEHVLGHIFQGELMRRLKSALEIEDQSKVPLTADDTIVACSFTAEEAKDSGPINIKSFKATDPNEKTVKVDSYTEDYPTKESAASATKESTEEQMQNEGSVRLTEDSITGIRVSTEKDKEIKAEEDRCFGTTNVRVVMVESSTGEVQLDDIPLKGTSSNYENLETIKFESSQAEEINSLAVEKASSNSSSQLLHVGHENAGVESVVEYPKMDETGNLTLVSPAVSDSNNQALEVTDESGRRLAVEKLDKDEIDELKEAPETISTSKVVGVGIIRGDTTADQSLSADDLESDEKEKEVKPEGSSCFDTTNVKKVAGEAQLDDKPPEGTSSNDVSPGTNKSESSRQAEDEIDELKEAPAMMSTTKVEVVGTISEDATADQSLSTDNSLAVLQVSDEKEIKAEENSCFGTTKVEMVTVESITGEAQLDGKHPHRTSSTDESPGTSSQDEIPETINSESSQQDEETNPMKVENASPNSSSQLLQLDCENAGVESVLVENSNALEVGEFKLVSAAVFESSYQVFEETQESRQRLAVEKLDADVIEELKGLATPADESSQGEDSVKRIQVSDEKDKEIKAQGVSYFDTTNARGLMGETSKGEDHVDDKPLEGTSSNYKSPEIVKSEAPQQAEEINSVATSNLSSQLLHEGHENAGIESVIVENPNAQRVDEVKVLSSAVFESNCQAIEETRESRPRPVVENVDADEIKELKEASEMMFTSKISGFGAIFEDTTTDQTLSTGKLNNQLQSKNQENETAVRPKKTKVDTEAMEMLAQERLNKCSATHTDTAQKACLKSDEPREFKVYESEPRICEETKRESSNEEHKEGRTQGGLLKFTDHMQDEIKYIDCPLESEKLTEATESNENSSNRLLKENEKAFADVLEVHNHEAPIKSDDTEDLKAEIIELRTEGNQSNTKYEAGTMMNEEANEQIVEEKEVSLDSHPISLGAKKKGNHDDDLKAVEYPGKITNDTFSIQHEVKTAGENIRKDTTAEHGTIGDDTIKGDPPGEEGKSVAEVSTRIDHENQCDETNFASNPTQIIAQREKEWGMKSSEEAGSLSYPELSSTMQYTQTLEESSGRTFEMNVTAEAEGTESNHYQNTRTSEEVLQELQKPSEDTVHEIEVKDAKTGKARELDTKSKRPECGGEEKIGHLVEKLTEEPTLTIAEDTSISNISPREILQAAEHPNEEPDPLASKEKVKSQEAEIPLLHEEEKTDREKDVKERDDYQKANAGLEATDIKVKHKKSQNILSGVGSKVKHSISKVKKAITGKSSHPKTQSPEKQVQ